MQDTTGEPRTNSSVMYSYGPPYMAKQKQDDQLEHTYSSYLKIWDVALKTCQKRWTIGRSGYPCRRHDMMMMMMTHVILKRFIDWKFLFFIQIVHHNKAIIWCNYFTSSVSKTTNKPNINKYYSWIIIFAINIIKKFFY